MPCRTSIVLLWSAISSPPSQLSLILVLKRANPGSLFQTRSTTARSSPRPCKLQTARPSPRLPLISNLRSTRPLDNRRTTSNRSCAKRQRRTDNTTSVPGRLMLDLSPRRADVWPHSVLRLNIQLVHYRWQFSPARARTGRGCQLAFPAVPST